ncbi:hypothetical protein [Sporosarcina beigongshangi]|uniref:hypothetical protein n=1 Tax=Sporosarcina beigongshangi TaxID=2782538 RepID=UPI001939B7DF|nr:hypothetical protein [Sporosarcina beigongshangi]
MKGKQLAIGLVLFIILGIIAIYFAMQATFKKDANSMESVAEVLVEKAWAE